MRICQKNVARASKQRLHIAFLSVHEEDTPTREASIGVGLNNWLLQYRRALQCDPEGGKHRHCARRSSSHIAESQRSSTFWSRFFAQLRIVGRSAIGVRELWLGARVR
jgi:hypothetical protein